MQTVVIVIHLMIVLAMVGLVLLQKSEGGGLGMGGGGGGFMSSRGTANVLTRTTAILAAAFFATSLILSILAGIDRKPRSILDASGPAAPSAPAAPGAPLGGRAAACSTSCAARRRRRSRRPGRRCRGRSRINRGRVTGPFAFGDVNYEHVAASCCETDWFVELVHIAGLACAAFARRGLVESIREG